MTFYRLCERHISRPQSAMHAAAYRSGERLIHSGEIYDFTQRRDIIHSEIILPSNAPPEFYDRQALWSAVERAEDGSTRRKTARTAHEIILAFPREFTFDTSIIIAREFIHNCFISQGMCVDFNVHRGDPKDNGHPEADHKEIPSHNPHSHISLSTRHIERGGFSKYKAREWESWNNSTLLIQWRKEWANIQNRMFERKGLEARVSHERRVDRDRNENEHSRGREL